MKKILIFSTTYFPFVGGAEVAVAEITKRIPNIEFHLITLRFDNRLPQQEKIGNITIHRIGFAGGSNKEVPRIKFPLTLNKYIFPFLASRKARALHKKEHFSAVWAIMAAYAGLAAMFFKKKHKDVPYILTLQEGTPPEDIRRKGSFISSWFRQIFSRADIIQTISHYLQSFAKGMGYLGEIVIVPNGVDVKHFSEKFDHFETENIERLILRATKDKSLHPDILIDPPRFIITISRLVEKNAVADTIEALTHLPNDIHLLIAGDGPLREDLKQMCNDLDLSARVHFLGEISHKDLPKYLSFSKVFIRPSLSEGFGNAFIEAMAAGVPVVATKVGGIPDFLSDPTVLHIGGKSTGLYCEVHSPEDVADKIMVLLEDTELRSEIVTNAREMVKEKYDWNIIANEMKEKIFDKVVSQDLLKKDVQS